MFGCFRRDEAADPDTFVAAVTMILAHYSPRVVEAVTDPFSGLPTRKNERGYSGLPDVADVKEACEAEAARVQRLATYAKLGTTQRRLPAPPRPQEATIFTAQGFPHYEKLKRRYEAGERPAHFANHVCVDKVERYGIWTPFNWIEEAGPKTAKKLGQYTDAELRAMYPPRTSEPQSEGAQ